MGGASRARSLAKTNRVRGLGGVKMVSGPTAGSGVDSEGSWTGAGSGVDSEGSWTGAGSGVDSEGSRTGAGSGVDSEGSRTGASSGVDSGSGLDSGGNSRGETDSRANSWAGVGRSRLWADINSRVDS